VPENFRFEHCLLLVMWVYVLRVWWRLNRRKVTGWWQRAKDHLPGSSVAKRGKNQERAQLRLFAAKIYRGG
jgi:hypothetical protein